MNNDTIKIVVFTDLDGSLLDHETYDYTPALETIRRLERNGIPLIPVTSKTLAEIDAPGVPFGAVPKIVENGMAISVPPGFFPPPDHEAQVFAPGKPYTDIIAFIEALPETLRCHIVGFHDMSTEEIAVHTGLSRSGAKLAKQRMGSEPFLWSGDPAGMAALEKRVALADLGITRGGRFYHLTGRGGKDTAIAWVLERLARKNGGKTPVSIALGDGPNDAGMLACVDYGIRIPNARGKAFVIPSPRGSLITAPCEGPAGWAAALDAKLDDLGLSR